MSGWVADIAGCSPTMGCDYTISNGEGTLVWMVIVVVLVIVGLGLDRQP